MKKTILILSLALTFPATVMLAQAPHGKGGPGGPPPPGGPGHEGGPEVHDDPHRNPMFHALLRALDTDGDGIISMSEMNHAAESLLALDKNNDGELSHEELVRPGQHGPGDHRPPPPPKADGDKDPAPKVDADKDDDKKPDGNPDGGKKPHKAKDGDNDGNPPPPPPPREDEQRSALVDAIDTNHDGKISADEIAAARANLKKLDLNHDGKLEPHEYGRPHPKNN